MVFYEHVGSESESNLWMLFILAFIIIKFLSIINNLVHSAAQY